MATISLPSVVLLIDDSTDISMLIDVSEEEEEKGNEKNKELEVFQLNSENSKIAYFNSVELNEIGYLFKTYTIPHLNLISAPPDYVL
jgi:hypothetical protein